MRHRLSRLTDSPAAWRVATAALAAVAAVVGSFAYAGLSPSFVGAPASTFVVETTPAAITNAVLDALGPLAQPASFGLALGVIGAVLAGTALVPLQIEVIADRRYLAIPLTGIGVWAVVATTTGDALGGAAAAVPAAAVVAVVAVAAERDPLDVHQTRRTRTPGRTRRAALQTGFATLSFAGAGSLLGRRRTPDSEVPSLDGGTAPPLSMRTRLADADEAAFDLSNAPGLVSRIGAFYTVDINSIDPVVDSDGWQLTIAGADGAEATVDYDRLRGMDAETFFSTLRCVGEDLNARQMDTALWTGVPVPTVLEAAGVDPDGEFAVCHADDGYWNVVPADVLADSYVVYGMNGRELPREHGHPVRLLVPGHWGEVNVKWLTELEFANEDRDGYWEERDWEGTGEVNTVAKIWSVDRDGDEIAVGGHTYAGKRGVETVEVSTDGGETWADAELSAELEGPDAWRQWRHAFEPTRESHEVIVRATDGTGTVQTEERTDDFPDGATGWVSRTIDR